MVKSKTKMLSQSRLDIAKEILLTPADLAIDQLHSVLENMLTRQIDLADLYFQESCSESWFLENSIVKDASYHFERGVGVRAISGEKTGLAYSNDIDISSLSEAADMAKSIAKNQGHQRVCVLKSVNGLDLYESINPLNLY